MEVRAAPASGDASTDRGASLARWASTTYGRAGTRGGMAGRDGVGMGFTSITRDDS